MVVLVKERDRSPMDEDEATAEVGKVAFVISPPIVLTWLTQMSRGSQIG